MSFDYGKYFGEIKLTHDLLTKKDDRTWLLKPPRDGERHDVVLYLGCNVLRTSHMVQTATAIFDRLGRPGAANYGAALALASLLMLVTSSVMLALQRRGRSEF